MVGNPLLWILALPGLLLGMYAQSRIKSNFTKYSQVGTYGNVTGAQVARQLLDSQGLQDIAIETTPGVLSDHYDPKAKVLRLSQEVYHTPSVAAAGVAAHEAGHALQDAVNYLPMELRSFIVPGVQLSASVAPWLFVAGLMLGITQLVWVGVILFAASTFFSLVTLPVEINASNRAKSLLESQGIIQGSDQIAGVRKVLGAAAWTYVAGAVSAIGTLFYYVLVAFSGSRRRQ